MLAAVTLTGWSEAVAGVVLVLAGAVMFTFADGIESFWLAVLPGERNRRERSESYRRYMRYGGPAFLVVMGVLVIVSGLMTI